MKKSYNQSQCVRFILIIFVVLMFLQGVSIFNVHIGDFMNVNQDDINISNNETEETLKKQLYCQYDPNINYEKADGGLKIYIPTYNGYIVYTFIHTVYPEFNADIWRLGQAFMCDDNFQNLQAITPVGAEWDMALRINGRDDFIGGYAHGDEVFTSLSFYIDGIARHITSVKKLTPFEEIMITETSTGYDPNDHITETLTHYKEYVISEGGVTLHQRVKWLGNYTIDTSFMAMMPPLKTLTDMFYTNADYKPTKVLYSTPYYDVTKAVVYGSQSNLSFSMSVPKQPTLTGGKYFSMTDNGNGLYNKMYFIICNGHDVVRGDIWETTTCYNITNG